MPDDDAEIVATLVEFLYKGDYSDPQPSPFSNYSRPASPTSPEPISLVPPSNTRAHLQVGGSTGIVSNALVSLLKNTTSVVPAHPETARGKAPLGTALHNKIFHAEVYVMADKYNCPDLMKLCMQKIDNCKLPDNDELLKYWAAIYDISGAESKLRIINRLNNLGVSASKRWIRSLWKDYPVELLYVIEQFPEFARDMMVLLSWPE